MTLAEAKEITERLEKANVEAKQIAERLEKAKHEQAVGGQSMAGQVPTVVDYETEKKNRVNKMLEGTGFHI